MNVIVIKVDPTIVQIGHFMHRWYGLFFTLAIVAGVWLGLREARRKGLDVELVEGMVLWVVIGGLIGARLFHVVDRWDLYAAQPIHALFLWEGGLAVYGGFAGGLLSGLAYALWYRLPVWKLADAAAPGMILGQAVGRLACIPNGDAYGAPTNLPWGFIYTNPQSMVPRELLGVPTQPYALYEMLFDLMVLALLWRLRKVFKSDGPLFLTAMALYALGRFFLTFVRLEKIWFWGLQEAQVIALVALVIVLPLLVWRLSVGSREADAMRFAPIPTRPKARYSTSRGR